MDNIDIEEMDTKFNTKWIPYIIIGVLVIILYFVWGYKSGDGDENQTIVDAEAKIMLLEQQLTEKDSIIDIRTHERDSALVSVRDKIVDDHKNIKIKYVKVKSDIVNLSDDASIELLSKNLGTR